MKMTSLLPATLTLISIAIAAPALAERARPAGASAAPKPSAAAVATVPATPHGKPTAGGASPQFKAPTRTLRDWYCGTGAGPGGHAVCTDALIASCKGKYHPPGTFGPHQTWGTCHEPS